MNVRRRPTNTAGPRCPRHPVWIASSLALGGMVLSPALWAQSAAPAAAAASEPAAAAPAPAAAASAPAAAEPRSTSALDSVVVTARKKREKLSDVPMSVSAVSAKTLEDAGTKSLQDITRLAPGLTLNTAGGEANLRPTIRGLTDMTGGSGDPNVAVFLDGVYLANPSAISLGMLDLERVEIIKGPVGALYGRNAFAGVINYVSRRPTDLFEGSTTAAVSENSGRSLALSMRGAPRPGVVRAGLSVSFDRLDRTHTDPVNGLGVGGFDKRDAQVMLEVTPSTGFTVVGSYYYGDDFFDNTAARPMANNCGVKQGGIGITAGQFLQYCGEITGGSVEVAPINPSSAPTGNQRRVQFSSLRSEYDLGWSDLTGILGYNTVEQQRFADFFGARDGVPFYTYDTATGTYGRVNLPQLFGNEYNNSDSSLDLRLSSKLNQPTRWSGGFYAFKGQRTTGTLVGLDGSGMPSTTYLSAEGSDSDNNPATLPTPLATANFYLSRTGVFSFANLTRTRSTDSVRSVFGSMEHDFSSMLTATGELRHTQQAKAQFNAATGAGRLDADTAFNNYRFTLRAKPDTAATFYSSVASGTKGGGFNANGVATATRSADYNYESRFDAETNVTVEAGWKQSWQGGRMQTSLAVFRVQSENLQINGPSDDPKTTGLLVKNYGGLDSTGFEFDFAARPIPELTANLGIGFVDSKFAADSVDLSSADVAACLAIDSCKGRVGTYQLGDRSVQGMSLEGLAPPHTSKVTASVGLQYNGTWGEDRTWFARSDLRYESKQNPRFGNGNPLGINYYPARTVLNLRGGVEQGDYKVQLYVNNATDSKTPDGAGQNVRLNDFNGQIVAYLPAPRTVGVSVNMKF